MSTDSGWQPEQGPCLEDNRDFSHTTTRKWIRPILANLEEGLELLLEITALEDTLPPPGWDLKKRTQLTSTQKKWHPEIMISSMDVVLSPYMCGNAAIGEQYSS